MREAYLLQCSLDEASVTRRKKIERKAYYGAKSVKSPRNRPTSPIKRTTSRSPFREATPPPTPSPVTTPKISALNDARTAHFEDVSAFAGTIQLFRYSSQRHKDTGITESMIFEIPTMEHHVDQERIKKKIFLLQVGERVDVKIWVKHKHDAPWKQKKVECKVIEAKFTECSVEYGV